MMKTEGEATYIGRENRRTVRVMVRSTIRDGRPGRGSNALVLAGREAYDERRALAELADVSPPHANVLAVCYGRDAGGWLTDWHEQVGGLSASMAVLSPGEFARSAAASASSTHELPGRTTVEAIDDPADLATLGRRAREHLSRWNGEDRQRVVLFESVTDLLSHVRPRAAFGFLHLLAHQASRRGATGWFYADPDAFPPATVGTVADLFDAVVRPHGDGWRLTREYNPADHRPVDHVRSDGDETHPEGSLEDER